MRCATPNSRRPRQAAHPLTTARPWRPLPIQARRAFDGRLLFLPVLTVWLTLPIAPVLAVQGEASAAALRTYQAAQDHSRKEATNVQAAWEYSRACFDLADYATNSAERAKIAEQGIAAARQALVRDTNCAPAHYYLGLNLGQLARTRTLGALRIVPQMEREFLRAIELEEKFDYAGPDRSLGLLYRDAPSFSIGNRSKARKYLQRAAELAPQYPENLLNLAESELEWGNGDAAARKAKSLDDLWPKAQAEFSGPAWTSNWSDWAARRAQLRKKLGGPSRLEAPRH